MAKEVTGFVKLEIKGGAANPAPPIGPALGSKGVNIMEFCKAFNAKTKDKAGKVVPVVITVYSDKSFDFVLKTSPAGAQLKEILKVGTITWDQVKAIAEDKLPDLNCFTVESAMKMVAGTAKSMGIVVSGPAPFDN